MNRSVLLAAAALLVLSSPALAHEHVTVADTFELSVGWRNEPAFVGEPNGLDLKVERFVKTVEEGEEEDHEHTEGEHAPASEKEVVLGAESNLTVTYTYGGKTFSPVDFRPAFGRPGWYTAEITPTRPGVYTVHITGTLDGTPVDVTVEPHEVDDLDDTSFPEKDPAYHETAAKVADLEARVAKLEADVQAQIDDPPVPTGADAKPAPASGLLAVLAVALIVGVAVRRRER